MSLKVTGHKGFYWGNEDILKDILQLNYDDVSQ